MTEYALSHQYADRIQHQMLITRPRKTRLFDSGNSPNYKAFTLPKSFSGLISYGFAVALNLNGIFIPLAVLNNGFHLHGEKSIKLGLRFFDEPCRNSFLGRFFFFTS